MVDSAFLTAKLSVPPLRGDYVPRPRLITRLEEGLARKLTLISTQTGFGKTTILCEWLRKANHKAAWLSLDEDDNDHQRFIAYVMASLRASKIGLENSIQAVSLAQAQGQSIESPMAALLNDFSTLPADQKPVIIILDDYHVIHNPQIHESMAFALEYIPPGVHIVIASRTDPPLPLALMRARRQINELRIQDLRFTHAESAFFLNRISGLSLSAEQVKILDDRTEGWAAGLQLAALAMSGLADVSTFIQDFTGSHRYVLDYLVDEVFSRQPKETQTFLLKTSLLDRMNVSLCDAMTEQANGRPMLEHLERENLFIVPLDNRGQWYRYHHLFTDLLRNRAEQFSAEERSAMHRRAALWFDAHNHPYDAINHALQALDYPLAIEMMIRATPALAMRSEISTLLSWLNELPAELRGANPRIPLMYAWAHFFMTDIDAVEQYIEETLQVLGQENLDSENWPDPIPPHSVEMLSQINALRTFVMVNRGNPTKAISIAQHALAHMPREEKLGRFGVLAALGDAYRDADNFAASSQAYSEALVISKSIGQFTASLTMLMDLARLRVKMGQLTHAEANCREVLASGSERYHPMFPVAQAYALLGDILRERNDLQAAEQTLLAGMRMCELSGYQRYLVLSHIAYARLKFAQNDRDGVILALDTAERIAGRSRSEPFQAWVRQFRIRLAYEGFENWLAQCRLTLDDAGAFQHEDGYLTLVRLTLWQYRQKHASSADLLAALQLLERLLISAQKSSRRGSIIEILALQALTLNQLHRQNDSLSKLQVALDLALPEGYVRLFADEGAPMSDILMLAIQRNIHTDYASQLVKEIDKHKNRSAAGGLAAVIFTDREGEVLRLLAAGLSNQEIADKLVISISTIKTHVTRIYAKLGVNNRSQAILRAQEMKIL